MTEAQDDWMFDFAHYVAPKGLFVVAPLPSWARSATVPSSAKVLLSRILLYASYDPDKCHASTPCFAAVRTLAKDTGLSVRTVQRNLRELEAHELIRPQYRKRQTTHLYVTPPKNAKRTKRDRLWLPLWVLRVYYLNPAQKLVYGALLQFASTWGHRYASYHEIANLAGVSRSTAIKAVRRLKTLGLVACQPTPGENRYWILPVDDMKGSLRKDAYPWLERDRWGTPYLRDLNALTDEERYEVLLKVDFDRLPCIEIISEATGLVLSEWERADQA